MFPRQSASFSWFPCPVDGTLVTWGTGCQEDEGLRYEATLGRKDVLERIPCPKQPKRLSVVLSLDEVARFFAAVIGIKHRAILMTIYAAGLRLTGPVTIAGLSCSVQRFTKSPLDLLVRIGVT